MTDDEKAFRRAVRAQLSRRTEILVDTRGEIWRQLSAALAAVRAILLGQPSDYQLWSLPRISAAIAAAMTTLGKDSAATLGDAAGKAWAAGQDLVDKPLAAGGIRIAAQLPVLDVRQLIAMRAFMTDRIKDISTQAANKINTSLGLVVIGAQTPGAAIGQVTEILGEPSRSRATTIVRTELGRAYAVAAHERLVAAAAKVPDLRKQWRRSGRRHPRLHHDAADGQIQNVEDPFTLFAPDGPVKLMHPHDPKAPIKETINCGCLALPFKGSWPASVPGRAPGGAAER